MKELCTLCKEEHEVDPNQFADAEAYRNGTLVCRKCGGKNFEWEASNLWCSECGQFQRA